MKLLLLALAWAFLGMSAYVVVMNWLCVHATWQNRRKGIDRHHSTIPVVSLLLYAIATLCHPALSRKLLVVPILDPGTWNLFLFLLIAPVTWLWIRLRRR